MLFKPELCDMIIAGKKTQTRRGFKPEYDFTYTPRDAYSVRFEFVDGECVARVGGMAQDRWRVGQVLAVQPGRGKHGVAKIEITEIRYCERAGDISGDDARAEGVANADEFRAVYARINGAPALERPCWALTFVKVNPDETSQLSP